MAEAPVPEGAPDDHLADLLTDGDLEVTGRLLEASNGTFFGQVSDGLQVLACVYKPIRGERPLWDFPDGTLASRERAAYLVSEAARWHVVPTTVLRDGPFGPGMVQRWIEVDPVAPQVAVVPAGRTPAGWFAVIDAFDTADQPVTLVHRDSPALRAIALFDAVVNNADRKGGHLLAAGGAVLGCDHGLTFHEEDKLRTVLWGWAGQPLAPAERTRLGRLRAQVLDGPLAEDLAALLDTGEHDALVDRIDLLLEGGVMPEPGDRWPTIPWPPL